MCLQYYIAKVFIRLNSLRNMSTKLTLVENQKVKYTGVFDLGDIYLHLHDWLFARKFDVAEKKYKEKIKGNSRAFEIKWEATKEVDEYSKYEITTLFLIDVEDVEAEDEDGKKKKMQKGSIEVFVSANLILDREDTWEVTPYIKFLKTFYEKYLYKNVIDNMKEELSAYGNDYLNEIKAYLNLYRF